MKKINSKEDILKIFDILKVFTKEFQDPLIEQLKNIYDDLTCFEVLIATILSLRSRDPITFKVYSNLRQLAKTPKELSELSIEKIEEIIRSIGFYHNKAFTIKNIAEYIVKYHNGKVPRDYDELIKIKGVGRKTANLVMTMCFNDDYICVDTHVHRLTNRLFLKTKDATQTEFDLMKIFEKKEWNNINLVLVKFGQNHCLVFKPKCKTCPVYEYCKFKDKEKYKNKIIK